MFESLVETSTTPLPGVLLECQTNDPIGICSREIRWQKMAKCPVCGMMGKPDIKSVYKGKTYYFMNQQHKEMFDSNPEKFNLEAGIKE